MILTHHMDMNPADFLTCPFHAVVKPKDTLLDCLRAKQASPDVKVPSIHDPNYKFNMISWLTWVCFLWIPFLSLAPQYPNWSTSHLLTSILPTVPITMILT